MHLLRRVLVTLPLLGSLGGCASSGSRLVDPPLKKPLVYNRDIYERGIVDPASLAVAANHFIRMGETRAVAALLAEEAAPHDHDGTDRNHRRMYYLTRILFESPRHPERIAPQRGLEVMPPEKIQAILRDWPLMPVVESQGVYFAGESPFFDIVSVGTREHLPDYLKICRKYGRFRQQEVKIPTRAEANAALKALLAKPAWKKLPEFYRQNSEREFPLAAAAVPE